MNKPPNQKQTLKTWLNPSALAALITAGAALWTAIFPVQEWFQQDMESKKLELKQEETYKDYILAYLNNDYDCPQKVSLLKYISWQHEKMDSRNWARNELKNLQCTEGVQQVVRKDVEAYIKNSCIPVVVYKPFSENRTLDSYQEDEQKGILEKCKEKNDGSWSWKAWYKGKQLLCYKCD